MAADVMRRRVVLFISDMFLGWKTPLRATRPQLLESCVRVTTRGHIPGTPKLFQVQSPEMRFVAIPALDHAIHQRFATNERREIF